jgi:hypothetical protein
MAGRTDPALHEHHGQVVVFNVEAMREDRQRLMEIDIIPRDVATLSSLMQVNVDVSKWAIVRWEPPSSN